MRIEKYFRQSVHQYGMGLELGTLRVVTLPQCPQHLSPGHKVCSNHPVAAFSSGNISNNEEW